MRLNYEFSEPFEYKRGIRQGCPTSLLIFDIYINDLIDDMKGIEIPNLDEKIAGFCFADDALLLSENIKDLKDKVNILKEWSEKNYMEVNAKKCGIISYSKRNTQTPVMYRENEILKLDKYVYLGAELNKKLDHKEISKHRVRAD